MLLSLQGRWTSRIVGTYTIVSCQASLESYIVLEQLHNTQQLSQLPLHKLRLHGHLGTATPLLRPRPSLAQRQTAFQLPAITK